MGPLALALALLAAGRKPRRGQYTYDRLRWWSWELNARQLWLESPPCHVGNEYACTFTAQPANTYNAWRRGIEQAGGEVRTA